MFIFPPLYLLIFIFASPYFYFPSSSATLGSPRGSNSSSDSELGNTKRDGSFFCIACRFLKQNKAKKMINATGAYKSYLCYALCYLQARFLSYIYPFTVKNFRLYVFLHFLKICEGGNPEATICFAVI